MTAAYEQRARARERIGHDDFEKLSTALYGRERYYNGHEGISMGDNLASIAIEEMMTIIVAKIRARERELRELGEKIWNDKNQEVNSRHEQSDRYSERASELEQLAEQME